MRFVRVRESSIEFVTDMLVIWIARSRATMSEGYKVIEEGMERGGGLGSSTISKNLMSPTPRRKWYLTTGRRFH